jgi:hypothetical protein
MERTNYLLAILFNDLGVSADFYRVTVGRSARFSLRCFCADYSQRPYLVRFCYSFVILKAQHVLCFMPSLNRISCIYPN